MQQQIPGRLLAKIAADRLVGKSLPQIAEELNRDEHFHPARGDVFSVSTVRAYALEAGRRLRVPMKLTKRRALS